MEQNRNHADKIISIYQRIVVNANNKSEYKSKLKMYSEYIFIYNLW